ncbi:hypothetical protein C7M84_019338 [Penaeus vannamei]|uniref:Uncharacterized protein n=1 Tax=Penaeus vannamei TaxID=6689 RepID=A0A423SF26_PENVA|nr:hypothetical protein C7M84_019338 [Penaeus vannamei]
MCRALRFVLLVSRCLLPAFGSASRSPSALLPIALLPLRLPPRLPMPPCTLSPPRSPCLLPSFLRSPSALLCSLFRLVSLPPSKLFCFPLPPRLPASFRAPLLSLRLVSPCLLPSSSCCFPSVSSPCLLSEALPLLSLLPPRLALPAPSKLRLVSPLPLPASSALPFRHSSALPAFQAPLVFLPSFPSLRLSPCSFQAAAFVSPASLPQPPPPSHCLFLQAPLSSLPCLPFLSLFLPFLFRLSSPCSFSSILPILFPPRLPAFPSVRSSCFSLSASVSPAPFRVRIVPSLRYQALLLSPSVSSPLPRFGAPLMLSPSPASPCLLPRSCCSAFPFRLVSLPPSALLCFPLPPLPCLLQAPQSSPCLLPALLCFFPFRLALLRLLTPSALLCFPLPLSPACSLPSAEARRFS